MHDSLQGSLELDLHNFEVPVLEDKVTGRPDIPYELYKFIINYADSSPVSTRIAYLKRRTELGKVRRGDFLNLVNLYRVNDIRYLNKFFNAVNNALPYRGVFIGCVETLALRKKRIFRKYNPVYARMFYAVDFIYKRIFPKWGPTRRLYFLLTKGRNRTLSKAETLGRLISCGFKIEGIKEINGHLYFAARNVETPSYDPDPTYGPFVHLKRFGRNDKPITVYKIRTMHPYAEYLQSYVYKLYNIKDGGKFNHDFRVTSWGRFLRKYWLDEIPMIYNFIKGDLKLVGVRPLSPHYLSLYTEKHKQRRRNYKPGLFPPFYAHMPKTLDEIMASEAQYFDEYDRSPWKTDVKYFWLVVKSIFWSHARSS